MKLEFKCPYCNASLDADIDQETELSCPACNQVFSVPPTDHGSQTPDHALLDPSDPAGYFNNFPTEDDLLC